MAFPVPSWPHGDDTAIEWNQDNPKRLGTKSYDRYEQYKGSKTVREAKRSGVTAADFGNDFAKGFLKISKQKPTAGAQDDSKSKVKKDEASAKDSREAVKAAKKDAIPSKDAKEPKKDVEALTKDVAKDKKKDTIAAKDSKEGLKEAKKQVTVAKDVKKESAPKSASVSSSSSAAPKTAAVAQSDPKKEAAQTLDAGSSKDAAVESPGPKKKKRRLELASPTQLKKNEEDASADTRPKEKATEGIEDGSEDDGNGLDASGSSFAKTVGPCISYAAQEKRGGCKRRYKAKGEGSSSSCTRPKLQNGVAHSPSWDLNRLREKAQQAQLQRCKADLPTDLEGLAAVLFLDIDGVVHPFAARHLRMQFTKNCMDLLKDVLTTSQASIVLSTAWREDAESRNIIAEKLAEHGMPPFVSRTPSIARRRRTREILAWVRKYRPQTWVAVDDLPLLEENDEMRNHFVQTNPNFGMRQMDADKIIQLFRLQRSRLDRISSDACDIQK